MRPHPATRSSAAAALGACLALASLAVVLAPAAGAETWAGRDPRGDAGAFTIQPVLDPDADPMACPTTTDVDSGLEKSVDITRLAVQHRRDTVRIKVSYDDLYSRADLYTSVALKTSRRDFEVMLSGRASGRHVVDLTTLPNYPDPDDIGECGAFSVSSEVITCPGLDVRALPAADVLEMTIPRTCLDNPPYVRAAAQTSAFRDQTFAYDTWAPDGDETGFVGPFGPRVWAARGADLAKPPPSTVPGPGLRERRVSTDNGMATLPR